MLKNQKLIWQNTPDHPWNDFGEITGNKVTSDDPLEASALIFWKEQTIGEFVKKVADAVSSGNETLSDPDLFSGFLLAVAALNLFPVHIKIVWDDEHASQFLKLLYEADGREFFLKKEIKEVEPNIEILIDYLKKNDLIEETDEKLFLKGRVLNKSHLLD